MDSFHSERTFRRHRRHQRISVLAGIDPSIPLAVYSGVHLPVIRRVHPIRAATPILPGLFVHFTLPVVADDNHSWSLMLSFTGTKGT